METVSSLERKRCNNCVTCQRYWDACEMVIISECVGERTHSYLDLRSCRSHASPAKSPDAHSAVTFGRKIYGHYPKPMNADYLQCHSVWQKSAIDSGLLFIYLQSATLLLFQLQLLGVRQQKRSSFTGSQTYTHQVYSLPFLRSAHLLVWKVKYRVRSKMAEKVNEYAKQWHTRPVLSID